VPLASIPSPSWNVLDLGPLDLHVYGVLIATGALLAALVTRRRYAGLGGDPETADAVATWALIGGFVGARLAYVSTHLSRYADGEWYRAFFIWEGGLALFGGLTLGAAAAIVALRRRGGDLPAYADAIAVGLPLAQAIGRWGNYFNQELFGTPTTLPWALEIAPPNRPAAYAAYETFHPTFLYESLWNLMLVGALLTIERRVRLRRGSLFLVYLAGYGAMRFLLELLRTDTTFRLFGLSRNAYVALAAVIGATT
jgi:prolipoprotein diacylglyceryl transferase